MNRLFTFWALRWRGILLVVVTYFYFLIFAQFGFLHRLSESLGSELWNPVLGAMGLSGLVGALWTAYKYDTLDGARWLLLGFVGAAGGALFAAIGTHVLVFFLSAVVSGFSLALLTVALVGVLAQAFPAKQIGLLCGMGTGLAYFLSNVPFIFEASAQLKCSLAGAACVGGVVLSMGRWMEFSEKFELQQNHPGRASRPPLAKEGSNHTPHLPRGGPLCNALRVLARWEGFCGGVTCELPMRKLYGVMIIFLVLIWADSAAFTRIQTTEELKSISWSGSANLWCIGLVHLAAAVLGGWLMDRRKSLWVYLAAFVGLMMGLLLLEAHRFGLLPTLIYASAVSLYSTALVAFAIVEPRMGKPVICAGVVFGLSGWLGSAMGIGMVNDLGRVPFLFWVIAAVVFLAGLFLSARRCAL